MNTSKKILIAEADPLILDSLSKMMQFYDYNVVSVSSGNKAIQILKSNLDFDLIITDHTMSDGDGIALIEYSYKNKLRIPIILMTEVGDKKLALKMIDYQIFGLIEKPLNFETLNRLVLDAIATKLEKDKTLGLVEVGKNVINVLPFILQIEKKVKELKNKSFQIKNRELNEIISNIDLTTKKIKGKFPILILGKIEKIQLQAIFSKLQALVIPYAVERKVPLILPIIDFDLFGNKEELVNTLVFLIKNSINLVSCLEDRWVKIEAIKELNVVKLIIFDSSDSKNQLKNFVSTNKIHKDILLAKKALVRVKTIELMRSGSSKFKYSLGKEITETKITLSLSLLS